MALIKTKVVSSGVSFDYHKIISIQFEEGAQALIKLASYLNKEARTTGKDAVEVSTFYVDIADKTNLIGSAYAALKTSNKIVNVITPEKVEEIAEVKNEAGEVIQSAYQDIIPAVTEEVETNFFADALDA